MAKKSKKKEVSEIKTNHHKRYIILASLFIMLLVISFFAVRVYVKNEKKESFVQGAQSAIHDIVTEVKTKGGVGIKQGEEIIILAQYTKNTNNSVEYTTEEPQTNETVATANETA